VLEGGHGRIGDSGVERKRMGVCACACVSKQLHAFNECTLVFSWDDGENRTLTCPSPSSATSAAVEAVASVWTFTLRMVEKDGCQSPFDCGQGKQGKQGNDPLC
jgi:hypothetical protein